MSSRQILSVWLNCLTFYIFVMIKCDVTLCAVIDRQAQVKQGKDGQSFISFGVKVRIEGRDGVQSDLSVSVSVDGDKGKASVYTTGRRVQVKGILSPRKKGDSIYFNLRATAVDLVKSTEPDSIEGEMHFQGKIGKDRNGKPAVDNRTDKKGNPFQTFSAYSSEKEGDNREYLWVRFLNFSPNNESFVKAEAFVVVRGLLQLGVYNGKLDIGCRVKEIQPWTIQNNNG